ncbi:MAG: glycine cleavage T C-terminal barrel domain-containing protein, partial [Pseudomonadota bacterium]
PFETGLDRFVKMDKDFVGKAALEARQAKGPTARLVSLKVDCTTAPAHPGASLMRDGAVVGTVTSGDWGHRLGMNIAFAFVRPDIAAVGTKTQIDMLGHRVDAEVITPGPYDPEMRLPRG